MGVFGAIQEEFKRMIKTEDELDEELDEEQEDYDDYDQSYADDSYDDEEEEEDEAPQRTSRFNFGFGGKSRKRERRSYGYDAEEEQQEEEPAPAAATGSSYGTGRDYSSRDYSASASRPSAASTGRSYSTGASTTGSSRTKRSNVVDFNAGEQQQVKVVRPKKFQDGTEYAECLRANQTIVMNLEETPEDVQRRVTDFICGAAFALGGKVKGVNKTTLVATPYTMDIVGDKIDGLLNNELEN